MESKLRMVEWPVCLQLPVTRILRNYLRCRHFKFVGFWNCTLLQCVLFWGTQFTPPCKTYINGVGDTPIFVPIEELKHVLAILSTAALSIWISLLSEIFDKKLPCVGP